MELKVWLEQEIEQARTCRKECEKHTEAAWYLSREITLSEVRDIIKEIQNNNSVIASGFSKGDKVKVSDEFFQALKKPNDNKVYIVEYVRSHKNLSAMVKLEGDNLEWDSGWLELVKE